MRAAFPRLAPPPDASWQGHGVDALLGEITLITGGLAVLVVVTLAVLLVRYRARPGHRAAYVRGDGRGQQLAVVGLAVLAFGAIDARLVSRAHGDLTTRTAGVHGADVVRVEMLPQQFAWNVRLAGPDGRFATADDALALNELHVPVDTPVSVQLVAKDVIHSFFVPALRIKQDAIPGRMTTTWFRAAREGTYEIVCAQLCGVAHYRMRGELVVESRAAYDGWVARTSRLAAQQYVPTDAEAHWGWPWRD